MWYERDGPRRRREASICGKGASHQRIKTILTLLAFMHMSQMLSQNQNFFYKALQSNRKNSIDTDRQIEDFMASPRLGFDQNIPITHLDA